MKRINPEKIREDIKEKYGDGADIDLSTYIKTNEKARLICPIHGEFWAVVASVRAGHWCPKCAIECNAKKATVSPEVRAQQVYELYGDSFILDKSTCTVVMNDARFICYKHGEVWERLDNVLNGQGCRFCGIERTFNSHKKLVDIFEQEYKRIHNDAFDFDKSTFIDMRQKARFVCPIHGEFWKSPTKVNQGQGCPFCSYERVGILNSVPIEENIKRISEIFGDRIKLLFEQGLKTMSRATFVCKEHGEFKAVINDMLHGGDCPRCTVSKLEKPVFDLLTKKKCKFKYNQPLKGCRMEGSNRDLRPDFLFDDYPLVFELDGYQHYALMYDLSTLIKIQERDLVKNVYCKNNGYVLLRVVSDDKIDLVTGNYITLSKLIELINDGISDKGEVDLTKFSFYDFNGFEKF